MEKSTENQSELLLKTLNSCPQLVLGLRVCYMECEALKEAVPLMIVVLDNLQFEFTDFHRQQCVNLYGSIINHIGESGVR